MHELRLEEVWYVEEGEEYQGFVVAEYNEDGTYRRCATPPLSAGAAMRYAVKMAEEQYNEGEVRVVIQFP